MGSLCVCQIVIHIVLNERLLLLVLTILILVPFGLQQAAHALQLAGELDVARVALPARTEHRCMSHSSA